MSSQHGRVRGLLLPLVAVGLLGPIIYLGVLALQGHRLIKSHLLPRVHVDSRDPRLWLAIALLAGLAALIGWALAERARARINAATEHSAAEAREAEVKREEAEQGRQTAEQRVEQNEVQLQEAKAELEREREAWRRQRDWNRKLRDQLDRLRHVHGVLGELDPRELLLRLTIELVDAEKGLLLARGEGPNAGLEVVCAQGFDHDPSRSRIAEHFADRVIERDTMIREDNRRVVEAEGDSAADDEVRNLLAIPVYVTDDIHGAIVCVNREGGFEELDDDVLISVGNHAGSVLENSRLHGQLRSAYLQTVKILSSVIEVKDTDLRGHSDAVAEYAVAVAEKLGFEPDRREALMFAALLHDVGKIGISERILLKPAALTAEEFSVMQLHPRIGYHLIRQIPALEPIAPAILHHHERFDGTGYPGHLRGETIPMEARIIAVADAFSAMTTTRAYREPVSFQDACTELLRCAGAQFDPAVVELFVSEVRRRPPEEIGAAPAQPDPELELHRAPGSMVLGGSAFGLIDSLTLLHSRRHFHETADAEAKRAELQGRPFSVFVVQVEELAWINRQRGYGAGDEALQTAADAVRRTAASVDGMAFRVAGSRLGLVAAALDEEGAGRLAESLCAALEDGPAGSVGVATWRPGESAEETIERAAQMTHEDEMVAEDPASATSATPPATPAETETEAEPPTPAAAFPATPAAPATPATPAAETDTQTEPLEPTAPHPAAPVLADPLAPAPTPPSSPPPAPAEPARASNPVGARSMWRRRRRGA